MAFIIANLIIAVKRYKKEKKVNIGLPQPDEEQPQQNFYNNEVMNPSMISHKSKFIKMKKISTILALKKPFF